MPASTAPSASPKPFSLSLAVCAASAARTQPGANAANTAPMPRDLDIQRASISVMRTPN